MSVQTGIGERLTGETILAGLVGHACHDLNNHLTTILGKAELGLMIHDPDRWRSSLEEILNAGQRARSLVADVQRLMVWLQSPGEPVTAGELMDLVVRVTARRRDQRSIGLVSDGSAQQLDRADAAWLAMTLWGTVRAALDTQPPPSSEPWRMSVVDDGASKLRGVSVRMPGVAWDPEEAAAVERSLRLGEEVAGGWSAVVTCLRALHGRLAFRDGELRLSIP